MPNAGDSVEVTRTYLELKERRPEKVVAWPSGVTLERATPCSVALSRALYAAVGRRYRWYDRDKWPDERLAAYLAQPNVAVWVLRHGSKLAGYFELEQQEDGSVEIVYFGLVASAQGKGLGRRLLEAAIQVGFATPASRVWLHTCTLDHPAALPNYLARGFVPYRTEKYEMMVLSGAL